MRLGHYLAETAVSVGARRALAFAPQSSILARMKRSWALVALFSSVASLSACTALLGSFEVGPGGGDADTGTGADGAATDGPAPGTDGGAEADAPVVCTAPEVACGSVCANLQSSVDHCGKCGRSCGGGTCTAGKCSTTLVVEIPDKVTSMDVGVNDVIFGFNDEMASCPKDGCKGATPKQLGKTQYGFANITVMNNGTVVFESAPVQSTHRPAIYGCPVTGCPGVLTSWISDGLNGFEQRIRTFAGDVFVNTGGNGLAWTSCTAGACTTPGNLLGIKGTRLLTPTPNAVYFVNSADTGIGKCLKTDTACVPTVVASGAFGDVATLAFDNGSLFWIKKGRDGFNEGKLFQCVLSTDCTQAANVKTLANGLDSPTELVVDDTGAYWLTAANKIERCLPGNCPGGPQELVPAGADLRHHVVIAQSFMYWVEVTKIFRTAK